MKLLSDYHLNPENPRIIRDTGLVKIKKSIKEAPWMMELRPIVVDDNNMVIGGDKRYQALTDLKYKEVPDEWIKEARDLTDDQKREFILKDNLHVGDWDWQKLKGWDSEQMEDWGLKIPEWELGGNSLLDTGDPGSLGGTHTAKTPNQGASSDGYAVFEQLLKVDDKKLLLETLNRVKEERKISLLGDALMHIIREFNISTKPQA